MAQFIGGVSADPIQGTLQEEMSSQLSFGFNYVVVEAVAQEQEDAEATISVTKRSEPFNLREEVLASSPLSNLQTAI